MFELMPGGRMPLKAYPRDAGYDLYAPYALAKPGDGYNTARVALRVRVRMPLDCVGLILPRSSLTGVGLHVHPGVIDAGYTGELHVDVYSFGSIAIARGQRIAQLVVVPCVSLGGEPAEDQERGDRGHGSSGP